MDALRYDDPAITSLDYFAGSRDHATPGDRLRHVRRQAHAFREQLLSAPPVPMMHSYDLAKVPYPTKYGLRDACSLPTPFLHILNRLFVVQFPTKWGTKTLLAEPLDRQGNAETPFFKDLADRVGGSSGLLANRVWPALNDVETVLDQLGIKPADIDYITYDHLHTQDLRKWLGTADRDAFFPNAKLLVTRQEWQSAQSLLPLQAQWYCPRGTEGIPQQKVVFFDEDILLGESVALVRSPGHTEGNHSIVVRTEEGIFVTSENGVAAECYAPQHSRIPGLQRYAARTGSEVVLNGNTLEDSVDQYISMVMEKEIAGPSMRNPDLPNIAPSSEMASHLLSLGLRPTFTVGELRLGSPTHTRTSA